MPSRKNSMTLACLLVDIMAIPRRSVKLEVEVESVGITNGNTQSLDWHSSVRRLNESLHSWDVP